MRRFFIKIPRQITVEEAFFIFANNCDIYKKTNNPDLKKCANCFEKDKYLKNCSEKTIKKPAEIARERVLKERE